MNFASIKSALENVVANLRNAVQGGSFNWNEVRKTLLQIDSQVTPEEKEQMVQQVRTTMGDAFTDALVKVDDAVREALQPTEAEIQATIKRLMEADDKTYRQRALAELGLAS